mmetsp:Transcript_10373/g.39238  ORF Transcript_10373/g.39238 Transcript_10373/m.39238 type:complete len:103 (-) Transcript_10373:1263-1571(-)
MRAGTQPVGPARQIRLLTCFLMPWRMALHSASSVKVGMLSRLRCFLLWSHVLLQPPPDDDSLPEASTRVQWPDELIYKRAPLNRWADQYRDEFKTTAAVLQR